MKRIKWKQISKFIGISLLTITLLLGGFAVYTVQRSFPQESGTIAISGLKDKVEVFRDRWGVPHIYASNRHDLFLAQGYVHAQDRFWQMDFWRHAGAGRLAEMFGQSQVKTDRFLRTMGWARVAQQEMVQFTDEMRNSLQSYADGVNAYLSTHRDSALSLEYAVLKFLNPRYQPEPWQPLHTLTWGKVMAWDLGHNMDKEIDRAILLQTLAPARVEELYPPYPDDHPYIVAEAPTKTTSAAAELAVNSELANAIAPLLQGLSSQLTSVNDLLGERSSEIGSNNWVISGKRTATGKPLLGNDPHLRVQMPSIWYENGLHCRPKGVDCPYDVDGFSFAGMAGAIVGHNDRIAWGVTNVGPDVMDLYIEKVNPNNPNQYEVDGKWVDMLAIAETIRVAGADPIRQTVRYTRHGPVISDTYEVLKPLEERKGLDYPEHYAIALRWTALEPSRLVYAITGLNLAQNWEDFRAAAKDFDIASQNLIYADREGNIGYQMPGKIPMRAKGDGRYPVAGWASEFDWKGYIPFEQLPSAFNPEQGFVATANNAVVGKDYSHLITTDWDYGFRARRIVDTIAGMTHPMTVADMQRLVGDTKNLNAETLVPILLQLPLQDRRLESARHLLQAWNFQNDMDGAAPALFEAFWKHLLAATFHDELPNNTWPAGGDRWLEILRRLVEQPDSYWWDDKHTEAVENRDFIVRSAFTAAVDELENLLGKDPDRWRWGKLHTLTFRNLTLGKSGIAPIEAIFNRGPFPISGGSAIVNATAWNAAKSFEATWLPSMRAIVDLDNFDRSLTIHSPGQSGHAFHAHYSDMVDPWRKNEFHPMLWGREAIAANAVNRLILTGN